MMTFRIRVHLLPFFGFFLLFFSHEGSATRKRNFRTNPPPDFGPDFTPSNLDNMNGGYAFSKTPGADSDFPNQFPKQFKDYPGGVESFEVYSPPMTTLYSQVWWEPLEPVDLPEHIVKKYEGKGLAIVGWEVDQVRKTADGQDEKSVPISASYNHHYVARMIGADTSFRKVKLDGPNDPLAEAIARQNSGCGSDQIPYDQELYLIEGPEVSPRGNPTWQLFSSGNGGEYRKTFHGFPPGHALVIDSPTKMQITPMQIDTWNRDEMDIDGEVPPKFVPGPLPRASLAPREGALHSGLLECPMTTRLTKVVDSANYTWWENTTRMCEEPILSSYECFEAAATLLGEDATNTIIHNETCHDPNLPRGCSVIVKMDGMYEVRFNKLTSSSTQCSELSRCVCPDDVTPFGFATGALLYHPTNQSADVGFFGKAAKFNQKCRRNPNLLDMQNPTCDIRYYRGGQWACKHMWSLLDADQEIPWTDRPLVFYHKYRFWVQPFVEHYHQPVTLGEAVGSALLIGSPWEYDVPKCNADTPGCALADDGTWIHTIEGSAVGRHTFVTLNNHCHAPTCISTSVYACRKGTDARDCNATTGELVCETRPIYGGTGDPTLVGTRFDEAGYIAIPDCLWGSDQYGLESPVDLNGIPLHIVKKANSTDGHYGEMSGGQPWVIVTRNDPAALIH